MTRIPIPLLFALALTAGCGEAKPPCDELADRLCAVADEAFCAVVKKQAAEKRDASSKQDECRAIVENDAKLQEILDGTRAATRFQMKAAVPEPKAKKTRAKKAKKAEAKPLAKTREVRPTAPPATTVRQVAPAPGPAAAPSPPPTPGTPR
jgi:hypothetical protein